MSPDQYERLQQLFLEVRGLPPPQRGDFLEDVSQREPSLRAELDLLLSQDDKSGRFVGAMAPGEGARVLAGVLDDSRLTAADGNASASRSPEPPQHIGPYTIIRLIGQGGMGVVYEAEQDDPRRRVALKVIRDGLTAPHLIERFHREAQMLGRLRHRGIAQIYAAHTSPAAGEPPYFVMELVDGLPLLKFANEHGLDVRQRLELIAEVCDALDHAHQHGLVHRDLKPANILVTEQGSGIRDQGSAGKSGSRRPDPRSPTADPSSAQPKILDFGVARSVDLETLTEAAPGCLIGTVPYMSPEQATGGALDARSDVYSVGVIAFELLTGRLPYDLTGKMIHEAARIIRDEEPTRLGAVDRRLRGDVEVMVARALEKDRGRRYSSAAELAADIRRHLCDQPIVAHAPSALYRLGKLAKRHKPLAAAVTVAALTMLIAGVVSLAQIGAARDARAEKERQRGIAADESWRKYVAAIAGAAAAIDNQDPELAGQFLSAAQRGHDTWEYRYVAARLAAYGDLIETETAIAAAAFAAEDRSLVTANRGGRLEWWDGRTSEPQSSVPLTQEITGPAEFSARGRRLAAAVGSDADDVVVWDCETGGEIGRLTSGEIAAALGRTEPAPLTAIAIAPDGEKVVLGAAGGVLWRPTDGERVGWLGGKFVKPLTFSADGLRFVAGYRNPDVRKTTFIRAFDATTAQPVDRPVGVNYSATSLAAPGAGKIALVATSANNAKFVAFENGGKTSAYGEGRGVTAVAIDPRDDSITMKSPDGLPVATARDDGLIGIYHRNTRELLRLFAGPRGSVSQLAFSCDGSRLLAVAGRFARIYRVEPLDAITVLRGRAAPVAAIAFNSDSQLVSLGSDGAARFWNARSGACQAAASIGEGDGACVAIAPAAALLATGHAGGVVRLWNAGTAEALGDLETGADERVAALAVSADGARIAIQSATRLSVWDRASARPLWSATLDGQSASATVVFSPDATLIAVGTGTHVRVWDAASGSLIRSSDAHAASVGALVFSPDGGQLVGGSRDGTLFIWDMRSGEKRVGITGHTAEVGAVAYSPDGARLVSGSDDGSIVLWDTTRWEQVLTLAGHRDGITTLAFSPDGLRLASGSADLTVRVWEAAPPP